MADKLTPGRINRKGLFLWQEDCPSGSGMNLWSGLLSANNGYSEEYALKAAMLFEAAPELVEALRGLLPVTFTGNPTREDEVRHWTREQELGNGQAKYVLAAYAALSKALGLEGEQG